MNRFLLGALACLAGLAQLASPATRAADPVPTKWLEGTPNANIGVNWGAFWPKGAVQKATPFALKTAAGQTVPMQTWPLAYWPDGSLKWTGHAISSGSGIAGPFDITPLVQGAAEPQAPAAIHINDSDSGIEIDTGGAQGVRARFPKTGSVIIDSLFVGTRKVAQNGKLTVQTEDRSQQADGIIRYVNYTSKVTKVALEQSGPIRTVVKVEGLHVADKAPTTGEPRQWLPFVMRFYFYAGSGSVRMVHSFIFDGDQQKDFIKGMGLSFAVPFVEELHNRHVRFAGEGTGVWCQPVRLIPGYRGALPQATYEQYLSGKRQPNLAQMGNRAAIESVAVYNDMKLTQVGPNSYAIDKRTTPASSWLHVTDGTRSLGLGVLADCSGGIAIGVKDFWHKYPASIEVSNAASSAGTLTVWLWSPDGEAMDLRTYDIVPHGLTTNYEDWKPGWGTATGVAHTTDMTLWAFPEIPSDQDLVNMAHAAAKPPVLVSTPEYYHTQQAFGLWSLPDRSTPTLKWVEDQLDQLYTFYRDQVNEREWYGFWNFGDVMHNYDAGRHDWRYDVGGWAWANTELMPDMFLWYTFLRSGKPDAYRMAEAMTRHTSETDVYHIGFFAPLGTRHNVNHWGDGAKQPRASHAMLKRYMYYLSGGDGRLGDLMDEQVDADLTYNKIRALDPGHFEANTYNPATSPYPPNQIAQRGVAAAAGGRGAGGGGRGGGQIAPTPGNLAPDSDPRYANASFGLDWICYSSNWTTKWERTGDTLWRDRVMAGMKNIVARSNGGPLGSNYFDIIFGGPEILFDEKQMYDYPQFWDGLTKVFQAVSNSRGGDMTAPRGAAYAAYALKNQDLGVLAWQDLVGAPIAAGTVIRPNALITGPEVVHPVTDPVFLGGNVGWQLHGVASIQWALNALETTELAKPYLKAFESGTGGGGRGAGGAGRGAAGRGARGAASGAGGAGASGAAGGAGGN